MKFPTGCSYAGNSHKGTWDKSATNSIIREFIPGGNWPPTKTALSMDDVFDYVEFFHLHAAWPTKYEGCGWDDYECAVEFDEAEGKRRYELEVNTLFERFAAPFRLVNGRIGRALPSVIEHELAYKLDFNDSVLNDLVAKAIDAFSDRHDRRVEATMLISSALEHWKSSEHTDFKKSTESLVNKLAKSDEQKKIINDSLLHLTGVTHKFIRHSRKEQPALQDPDFAECLFLVIFSVLAFGHKKYQDLSNCESKVF